MGAAIIREPQRTYLLEFLIALGPAADCFVLAGAQAIKFAVRAPRATKDFDFVLDVQSLRQLNYAVKGVLQSLGYVVVPSARNFQFEKPIPTSPEVMRIEFMAPQEYQRRLDFRVDIADDIHARGCLGANVVLLETDYREIEGYLPDGTATRARIRVTRPHALVMMKCLALDDRYRNLRGPDHYEHDREEARIHAADMIAVVRAQARLPDFRDRFVNQFNSDHRLGQRVFQIVKHYFGDENKPGLLLYEEYLNDRLDPGEKHRENIRGELQSATRLMAQLIVEGQL